MSTPARRTRARAAESIKDETELELSSKPSTSPATVTTPAVARDGTSWHSAMILVLSILVAADVVIRAAPLVRPHVPRLVGFRPQAPRARRPGSVPALAQVIDQTAFKVLPTVPSTSHSNATTQFIPPGCDAESLIERPFHIYDDEFYAVIGEYPTLTVVASSPLDPLFHEAVTWYPPTDEVFFVQNAGAPAAGTGMEKSAIIQKISLAEAAAVSALRNATGRVKVTTVNSNPMVINPNGGTNYKGSILWTGEGMGPDKPSALWLMNPREPYNTTIWLNNYFGRQFSSLNDVAVNPRNKDIYFTDTLYGYLQDFRPPPGLRNQVYRLDDVAGAVTVVADDFVLPNGIAFSPDGSHAYITDTGINMAFFGYNLSSPSTIYRFDVQPDGTFQNRKVFAFTNSGFQTVWNPSGKLIGKIHLGTTAANFRFAGNGRMVICAETELYYATLAASGADFIED